MTNARAIISYILTFILTLLILGLCLKTWFPDSLTSLATALGLEVSAKQNAVSQVGWELLTILTFISFLLSFKIVQYATRLQNKEKHAILDIIFVGIFFIFLFFPMVNISNETVLEQEKRMMATYKPLLDKNGINENFGANFEKFYNDRFGGRSTFINLNSYRLNLLNKWKISVFHSYENWVAYAGRDGWLFSKYGNSVNMAQNNNLFTESELMIIKDNLLVLDQWASKRQIVIYLEIHPDKESIYPEKLYTNHKVHPKSRREQLLASIPDLNSIKIVSSYESLIEGKSSGTLFSEAGSHATSLGAYIMYRNLYRVISKDYHLPPLILESEINRSTSGLKDCDIMESLGLSIEDYGKARLTEKRFLIERKPEPQKNDTVTKIDPYINYPSQITTYQHDNSTSSKVFIISDSFLNRYIQYIAYHFNQVTHVEVGDGRDFHLSFYAKEIEELNPDIIIISSTERFYQRLLNIHPPTELD